MIYCYRCPEAECDALHEEDHPLGKAPPEIVCPSCGARAARDYQAEGAGVAGAKLANDAKYPYVSQRLPRNLAGCATDSSGRPVIESKKHEANVMAKYGYRRD